jgi:nucleotide-binding universal stress UspA family protein
VAGNVGPVVVGTDFSDNAAIAASEARRLADLLGVGVDVVHVVENGGNWVGDGAERWLAAAGVSPDRLIVRYGSAWVELARYVAEVSPTLVVVGSHGTSGYQPLTIGSTASRVTVQSRCPVVLVSPRVAVAAEGSIQEQRTGHAIRAEAVAGSRDEPGGKLNTGEHAK